MQVLTPTTNPEIHAGLQRPVDGCKCDPCSFTRRTCGADGLRLPEDSTGPTAARYTLGPPSDSQIDVTDAVQRIEQAKEHEAQARDISLKVNNLLADRKLHQDTAAILRKEAADIIAGKY